MGARRGDYRDRVVGGTRHRRTHAHRRRRGSQGWTDPAALSERQSLAREGALAALHDRARPSDHGVYDPLDREQSWRGSALGWTDQLQTRRAIGDQLGVHRLSRQPHDDLRDDPWRCRNRPRETCSQREAITAKSLSRESVSWPPIIPEGDECSNAPAQRTPVTGAAASAASVIALMCPACHHGDDTYSTGAGIHATR